jgi:hypothetical protein
MRAVFTSLLLRECVHSSALASTQGGVQGGCCQAEGGQRGIFVIVLRSPATMIVIHILMRMSFIFNTCVIIPTYRFQSVLSAFVYSSLSLNVAARLPGGLGNTAVFGLLRRVRFLVPFYDVCRFVPAKCSLCYLPFCACCVLTMLSAAACCLLHAVWLRRLVPT